MGGISNLFKKLVRDQYAEPDRVCIVGRKQDWNTHPTERCEDYENAFACYLYNVLMDKEQDEVMQILEDGG